MTRDFHRFLQSMTGADDPKPKGVRGKYYGKVNLPVPSIQPYPGTPGGRPKDKTAAEERAAILLHVRRMVKGETPDDTDVYINGTKLIEWLVKRGKK